MPKCPTPNKSRYATTEGAESAAHRVKLAVGKLLEPYLCHPGCGWWHLTTNRIEPIPAGAVADPAVVEHLAGLDDVEFRAIVTDEAKARASMPHRIALRSPILLRRWRKTLGLLMSDIDLQIRMLAAEKGPEWRRRALAYKTVLDARRREASTLMTAAWAEVEAQDAAAEHDRQAAACQGEPAAQRALAGRVAIDRLIGQHLEEFARYVAEECERLGVAPSKKIRRIVNGQKAAA